MYRQESVRGRSMIQLILLPLYDVYRQDELLDELILFVLSMSFLLNSWWNVCCGAEAGSWQPIAMCMTVLCQAPEFQKCIIVNNLHIHAWIKTTVRSPAAMRVLTANISAHSTQ